MTLAGKLLLTVATTAGRDADAATGGEEACRIKRVGRVVKYDHRADRVTGSRRRVGQATAERTPRERRGSK